MAYIIDLTTFVDHRGKLTVIEKAVPFAIKRVYYMYDVKSDEVRGEHRHKKTMQAAVCLHGLCSFYINDGIKEETFVLDRPDRCLVLEPQDRHTMQFSDNAILMVLASEYFDADDYIAEKPSIEKTS